LSKIKIIETADGSFSLLNEELNETYHSTHGAVQESKHVFIEHGLKKLQQSVSTISILEVGFGTGLNALLTFNEVMGNYNVEYTSLETFPLLEEVWNKLNYPDPFGIFSKLHEASWDMENAIAQNIKLRKVKQPIQSVDFLNQKFDLIYFDAFAPNKQPEMWEIPVLSKVVEVMNQGSIFVTYCAKGQLKRDLKSLGLLVESLPGPPGKREMIRAIKP
jgi:tRNA U34 5-methylaminomethyl-2-thiouridine-forming methyltransferase MnmC